LALAERTGVVIGVAARVGCSASRRQEIPLDIVLEENLGAIVRESFTKLWRGLVVLRIEEVMVGYGIPTNAIV
jgi:hypothetical protein